jgi:DNA modification methylase
MMGYGVNFQFCWHEIYTGRSFSYEQVYQAGKRMHRFGQTRQVQRYIVQTDTDDGVAAALLRKATQHEEMQELMRFTKETLSGQSNITIMNTEIKPVHGDNWTAYHGDCVRVARTLPDESIDFSVFSPPFADLFTYSSDVQDMGNCEDMEQFMVQFGFLIDELLRITLPGRLCAVHCVDLLSTKWKHGEIEFQDFSGEIKRAFRSRGWLLHCPITIWKNPVTEMQRTKAHGLLYKTLRSDSSKSRVGAAEYLLVFRKRGENPKPIIHSTDDFPLDEWQRIASPVWMGIDQGNVLNGREASEHADERHICPLALDIINNALKMWSAPGDTVFSPFTGIGSEGYCSLRMGRKFIGSELKESYFKTACENLRTATSQLELFTALA